MAKKSKFKYQKRGKDTVNKRANQQGGRFDSPFNNNFPMMRLKEGDFSLRILPPTWDDAEHYGFDVWVHYGIGSDNQAYICAEKMKGEPCPICDERKRAEREGDSEYAKELKVTKRVGVWVIDRDNEEEGPKIWGMPWTLDRDFASMSIDKRSKEVLCIDDPEDGYDIEFSKEGKGIQTKYVGTQVARRPSPLHDDEEIMNEWLDFITENPLPETLVYYEYEYIANVFAGGETEDDKNEDDEPPVRTRRGKKEEEPKEDESKDEPQEDEIDDASEPLDEEPKKLPRCFGDFDKKDKTCKKCDEADDCEKDTEPEDEPEPEPEKKPKKGLRAQIKTGVKNKGKK